MDPNWVIAGCAKIQAFCSIIGGGITLALVVVTIWYACLTRRNVKATSSMVEEMKSERTQKDLKATSYCLVKYGNYQSRNELIRGIANTTHQGSENVIDALYELDMEDRIELGSEFMWRVKQRYGSD
jgi:hypothetical protein